jgi:hypothetical protein
MNTNLRVFNVLMLSTLLLASGTAHANMLRAAKLGVGAAILVVTTTVAANKGVCPFMAVKPALNFLEEECGADKTDANRFSRLCPFQRSKPAAQNSQESADSKGQTPATHA